MKDQLIAYINGKPFYGSNYVSDFAQGKCYCGSDMMRKHQFILFSFGEKKCLRPNCKFNIEVIK